MRRTLPRTPLLRWAAAPLLAVCLASCGGGGDGGTQGGGPTLQGTAAAGAALKDALVTVKDRTGASVTTRTGLLDGTYRVDVTGLTPPFLVEVDDGAGTVLFSVGLGAGVVNVTPFTDLVISAFYAVHGIELDGAFFASFSAAAPAPSGIEVETLASVIETMIARWLQVRGIDPSAFDLITSPFAADGTGVDAVIDLTTITHTPLPGIATAVLAPPPGDTVVIDDGTTTQTSTLTTDTSGRVTVGTTTTSGGATTTSTDTTTIPTSTQGATDLAGVTDAIDQMFAVLNERGAALASDDVLPFHHADFLDDGRDRTLSAAEIATSFRELDSSVARVTRVRSIDEGSHVVWVGLDVAVTADGQTETEHDELAFKPGPGGGFVLFGNQQVLGTTVRMEARTQQDVFGTTHEQSINVDCEAPTGTVDDSVTIDGGPFVGTTVPRSPGTSTVVLRPTPGTTLDVLLDTFYRNSGNVVLPPAGTLFQVHLTPTGGSPATYEVVGNGVTNEHIAVTSPSGHGLAAAALDGTLLVQWTLPLTYPVARVTLSGHVEDASGNRLEVDSVEPALGPSATSGHLQLPASWDDAGGHHVTTRATIDVSTNGPNGERSMVLHVFQ